MALITTVLPTWKDLAQHMALQRYIAFYVISPIRRIWAGTAVLSRDTTQSVPQRRT